MHVYTSVWLKLNRTGLLLIFLLGSLGALTLWEVTRPQRGGNNPGTSNQTNQTVQNSWNILFFSVAVAHFFTHCSYPTFYSTCFTVCYLCDALVESEESYQLGLDVHVNVLTVVWKPHRIQILPRICRQISNRNPQTGIVINSKHQEWASVSQVHLQQNHRGYEGESKQEKRLIL